MGKLRYLAMGAAGLAAVLATPAFAGPNLVSNGDFNINGGTGQFNFNTTAAPWKVTGTAPGDPLGYAFIFNNSTAFTTGSHGEFSQVALDGSAALNGTPQPPWFYGVDSTFHPSDLTQTITGLKTGEKYNLTFEWASAQQQGFSGITNDSWHVKLGAEEHDTPTQTDPSQSFAGWFDATMTFTATGPSEVLSFVDVGHCITFPDACGVDSPGGPPFSLLDSVSLTASVPEPSTWAMMLIGFAGLGYAGLRSRRRTAISIV